MKLNKKKVKCLLELLSQRRGERKKRLRLKKKLPYKQTRKSGLKYSK